jgi:hypothetical protein
VNDKRHPLKMLIEEPTSGINAHRSRELPVRNYMSHNFPIPCTSYTHTHTHTHTHIKRGALEL